jgi:predicted nucleic-acid-binding Zn-ribbon protein
MSFEEKLLESFCCQKCRGRSAVVRQVLLPRSKLPKFLDPGKYIFLICTLCGYTEIYDQLAYARNEETAKKESSLIQEA